MGERPKLLQGRTTFCSGIVVWGRGQMEVELARTTLEALIFLHPIHSCCCFFLFEYYFEFLICENKKNKRKTFGGRLLFFKNVKHFISDEKDNADMF